MTYEEFKKEREVYEYLAHPTDEDFKRYTSAFISWAATVLRSIEERHGRLK